MNYTYICGNREFCSIQEAIRYANQVFKRDGVVLGIQVKD